MKDKSLRPLSPFPLWISDHVYSATELEDYLKCPYRFYANAYLKIKPESRWDIELSPAERGTLLHRVLEIFLSDLHQSHFFKKILLPDTLRDLESQILKILHQELTQFTLLRPGLSPFLLSRQKIKFERTLKNFVLKLAEEHETRKALVPSYFEWRFEGNHCLEIPLANGRKIKIKGRIDRIDIDPVQKRFLIVDYKTSHNVTGNQIISGESLQLPCYIWAVKQHLLTDYEPVGGLYYNLADMTCKDGILHADRLPDFIEIHPSSSSLVPANLWRNIFVDLTRHIENIVTQIESEQFPSEPEPCEDYCELKDICLLRHSKTQEIPL